MQTEVGEAFEPAAAGRGGSSTMPHKRNPIAAAVGAGRSDDRSATLLATILAPRRCRSTSARSAPGQAEWPTFPALALVTSGALAAIVDIAQGLEVDGERMRANLAATHGPIMAEAVSFGLADARQAGGPQDRRGGEPRGRIADERDLKEVLAENDRVTAATHAGRAFQAV